MIISNNDIYLFSVDFYLDLLLFGSYSGVFFMLYFRICCLNLIENRFQGRYCLFCFLTFYYGYLFCLSCRFILL